VKNKIRIVSSAVLIFFVLLSIVTGAEAKSSHENQKILMVIVDRVSYEDIARLPNFSEIISRGSIALMNNRPSGYYSACKSYVSIGSGARAEGTPSAVRAVQIDRENAGVFYRRTGIKALDGMVVNPEINMLIAQNERGEYGAIAGNIGHYLRNNGLRTAVIGNGDYENEQVRWAISIAMDRKGIVDYGWVDDSILDNDEYFSTGKRTGFKKIMSYLDEIEDSADFIVIETGDLTRIEETRELLSSEMYDFHRNNALDRIDSFIGDIKRKVDSKKWLLMLVTPYPSEASITKGDRLTPIIIYGNGYPPGLLVSGTTRREGIVGNVDIAATVLEYFRISGDDIVGRPLRGVPANNNLETVRQTNLRIVNTSNSRYPVLKNYAIFVIIVTLLGLITVLYPQLLGGKLGRIEKFLILAVMNFPLVLLLLPVLNLQSLAFTAAAIVLGVVLLTAIIHIAANNILYKIFIVSIITSIAVVLDIASGGHLIRGSLLGYDPIIGARYYGIGNEYMGVVAGSTLVAVSSILERKRVGLCAIGLALAIIFVIVGYPGLGANVGGAITCFIAFSFYLMRIKQTRIGLNQVLTVAAGLLTVIVGFVVFDMLFLENHSHLAAAVQGAASKGPLHLMFIINRKLSMNLKLLKYTIWTKVLITVIAATGILFYRPVGIFKRVFYKYPYLTKGWSAIVVAAAVGMLVNDSGVVTSATSSIFFMMSMLYVFIEERNLQGGARVTSQDCDGI
jgi:hypothetical protein